MHREERSLLPRGRDSRRYPPVAGELARFRAPDDRRAAAELVATLACFTMLWTGMYRALDVSYAITLALSVPTAALLLRLFLILHDCGHGSFFTSRPANERVGFLLGLVTLTPYHQWRRNHALHHAAACDLDRRGHGDIRLLTVSEYQKLGPLHRLGYRVLRSAPFLFLVAPLFHFVVLQRVPYYSAWSWKKSAAEDVRRWTVERRGVHVTNLLIVVALVLIELAIGLRRFVAVHLPVAWLAACAGMWLFHVQHTFDGARWMRHGEWSYVSASLDGSTYLKLPPILQWLTASIGLHHVHHLDSRIPSYRLQACLDATPALRAAPTLTVRDALPAVSLSLWDESRARFVRFSELRRPS